MLTPQEIELKLLVPGLSPDEALQRLRRAPSLRRRRPQQQLLLNRYFDTPDLALQRQRCALRLRHIGTPGDAGPGSWVQTLKTAGTSHGGLSQRGEWESPVAQGRLDPAALHGTAWDALDPHGTLLATLQPRFETHCLRTTWRVRRRNGTDIEVALDAGSVRAGDRTTPLLELELELLSGPRAALFALAQELAQHLPLLPSDVSKAQRGHALASGAVHPVAKAQPVPLKKRLPPQALARPVLAEILQQFTRNLEGLLHRDEPELVHQARVAWRRWRSVTRLLRPWLPAAPDTTALRPLLDALGQLRDLDVARHDTLPAWATAYLSPPPGLPDTAHPARARQADWDAALHALTDAGHTARAQVRQRLATPGAGGALLALTAWLHGLGAPIDPAPATPTPHGDWATRRLARWHRRMEQLVAAAHTQPALLHDARLLAKRLRYASEAIAATLPAAEARRTRRWTRRASGWQLRIGQQRDLWQAAHLLGHLPPTSDATAAPVSPELVGFFRGLAAALTPAGTPLQPAPPCAG
ncbi:CYTH and CHAD domain-containing protein [Aquabacterium sp. A08]|uniref:CYTH and CHAD domain-containing protein n=1 Tax=Aquabacterium sp. A08 TaxID=2718532 RepID=UPI001422BBBC|nr:CYTH and CHAD domain-containing protein [Aquabacterium sp. A08]NIC41962.1 CYTH and CHAD domain-containing protein [Aquabacterium sp. A08]NIC42009.1 CYTH and CHAD domain-containing protein [Aquabacterium sp. A08]NIC42441.1 CYTH and CHAD domain-containing protein [Aquabacterium sp. A08]